MNIEKNNTNFIIVDSDDNFDLLVRFYRKDIKYSTKAKGVFIDTKTKEVLGNPAPTFKRIYDDNAQLIIPSITQSVEWIDGLDMEVGDIYDRR